MCTQRCQTTFHITFSQHLAKYFESINYIYFICQACIVTGLLRTVFISKDYYPQEPIKGKGQLLKGHMLYV